LQMLLDRGELKDWFGSTEIWVEAAISGLGFYLFIVHTATATDRSFLNRDLLKNLNFGIGMVLMFMIGLIMNGTLALLPTMLQDLMNYPVLTTGLVTAPRGVGSMIAMFVVARLIDRVDNRLIILFGLGLTAVSMWQMTGFSLYMGTEPVITSGLLQGFGLGCTFVPLNTIALANLPRHMLTQGTALRSLMRNLGGKRRDRDPRGAAYRQHPDRPFPADRAAAAGQPAGAGAASCCAVQPDRSRRHRRPQRRGDPPSLDGRLHQRFRADDGDHNRLDDAVAAAPPAASPRGAAADYCRWRQPPPPPRRLARPDTRGFQEIGMRSPTGATHSSSSRPTGLRFARPKDRLRPGPRFPPFLGSGSKARIYGGLVPRERWAPAFAGVTVTGSMRLLRIFQRSAVPAPP
jgi:hypothetical protein